MSAILPNIHFGILSAASVNSVMSRVQPVDTMRYKSPALFAIAMATMGFSQGKIVEIEKAK
jgi:hypothetical protein